jgi:hypothetical protein
VTPGNIQYAMYYDSSLSSFTAGYAAYLLSKRVKYSKLNASSVSQADISHAAQDTSTPDEFNIAFLAIQ